MLKHNISGSIVVGGTTTNPIYTNEDSLVGLVFTGGSIAVTGSQVSFLVSHNGVDYYSLYDYTGSEVTMPVSGSNKAYYLNPIVFDPWNYLKLRLGITASPVAQATYDLLLTFVAERD
jgi:hypothetical protein